MEGGVLMERSSLKRDEAAQAQRGFVCAQILVAARRALSLERPVQAL